MTPGSPAYHFKFSAERLDRDLAVEVLENQRQRLQDERAVQEPVRGAAIRYACADCPHVELHGAVAAA